MKQASFPWLMRIKGRVLIFGIAMSIFPLLFLGLANFNATRLYLQERIQQQNFERATGLAEQISEFVVKKAESLSIVTYTNASTLVGQDQIAREMILAKLLRQESYFEAIEVADSNFNVIGQIDRRNVILPQKSDFQLKHRDLTEDASFSVSPVFFSNDGRPQFYLTVGIQDPLTRKNIGYLQAKTDLKGMVTKITNLRIGQAGYIYLTDEQGELIGHTDFSHVLRQENVRQNPDVQAFLAGQRPSPQGIDYTNPDGLQVIGLFAPVENLSWGVFIEQPIREAYQPIYEFSRKLLGILLVAIALVTLISIMFGLKLTRPIEKLEGEVRRIILTGDLKSEIPKQSQDEIGRLVQSFNQLLTATNRDLLAEVKEGRFRQDLYYRLNGLILEVPPLRERREDIFPLVDFYLQKFRSPGPERYLYSLSPETQKLLLNYDFPGNVRELAHLIQRGVTLANGQVIFPVDLWPNSHLEQKLIDDGIPLYHQTGSINGYPTLEDIERDYILETLKTANGNRAQAAKMLGISVRNLYRKLDQYGR